MNGSRTRRTALAAGMAVALGASLAGPAMAHDRSHHKPAPRVSTIVSGLQAPELGLAVSGKGTVYVSESFTGKVLRVKGHGTTRTVAQAQGFAVRELDLPAARSGKGTPRTLGLDASLLLDVVTIYFLLRFVKKPFRFFGGFGFAVLAVGGLLTAWLVVARLFFGVPLVDRPALVLTTLMIVLGIQIISVGLIGEIVAFTYAKDIKDYRVDRVVEPTDEVPAPTREPASAA